MLKYSVLISIYRKDNPDYFNLALESMTKQTVLPNEIVVVKDGKITDDLQNIIVKHKLLSKNIPFVEIHLKNNVGLGLALNEGIKACKYELIARMDSDDYSLPNRCELQLKEFEKEPELDIIGTSVLEFVDNIENIVGKRDVPKTNEEIYKFARLRDPFNHPSVMYKKSTILNVGGYSNYRKNQDTDLWIKLLQNNAKCKNLSEPLVLFRFDKNTYEKRKSFLSIKTLLKIRYKAWKTGFNSLFDFVLIVLSQLFIYALPDSFQKIIYRCFLRG